MLQDGSLSRFEPPKKAKNSEQNKNPTFFKTEILGKKDFITLLSFRSKLDCSRVN